MLKIFRFPLPVVRSRQNIIRKVSICLLIRVEDIVTSYLVPPMRFICWFNTTAASEYCRRRFSLRSSEYLCFFHEIDLVYRRAERTQVTYMFHRRRKLGVRQYVLGQPIKSPPILSASTVGIVSKKLSIDR